MTSITKHFIGLLISLGFVYKFQVTQTHNLRRLRSPLYQIPSNMSMNNYTLTGSKLKDMAYISLCLTLKCPSDTCCEGDIDQMACGTFSSCEVYRKYYIEQQKESLATKIIFPIIGILLAPFSRFSRRHQSEEDVDHAFDSWSSFAYFYYKSLVIILMLPCFLVYWIYKCIHNSKHEPSRGHVIVTNLPNFVERPAGVNTNIMFPNRIQRAGQLINYNEHLNRIMDVNLFMPMRGLHPRTNPNASQEVKNQAPHPPAMDNSSSNHNPNDVLRTRYSVNQNDLDMNPPMAAREINNFPRLPYRRIINGSSFQMRNNFLNIPN